MAAKGVYQSTNKVLMVLPKAFYSNPEATVDNAHMKPSKMTDAETTRLVRRYENALLSTAPLELTQQVDDDRHATSSAAS